MYFEHTALRILPEIMQAWPQHVAQWQFVMGNDTSMSKALHAPVLRQKGNATAVCRVKLLAARGIRKELLLFS